MLDEPNSNLDNEGEAALHQAIRDLKAAGTTIILVSHRLAALAVVDKVAILKDGRLERFEDRNAVLKDLMKPVANAATPVAPATGERAAAPKGPTEARAATEAAAKLPATASAAPSRLVQKVPALAQKK